MNTITHASVFSGIGGSEVAAVMLGWENLFHCEINPFGKAVLDYWFPNSKSYEDITTTDFSEWRGKVTVLTGGFPCQPFSYAGQRRGAQDTGTNGPQAYPWSSCRQTKQDSLDIIYEVIENGTKINNPIVKLLKPRNVMIFHEVKAVYEKQTGEDNPGKVKETYLVEAVNCADAEKQVMDEIKPFVFGDCETPQIRKRHLFDIFPGNGYNWYEAKVEMITIDGDKETRKAVKVLVQDDTIDGALKELHYKHLANFDCEILSIAKSPVLDILRPDKGE